MEREEEPGAGLIGTDLLGREHVLPHELLDLAEHGPALGGHLEELLAAGQRRGGGGNLGAARGQTG